MAVTVQVLLLVALISDSIHAEILQVDGRSHNFILDKAADFCAVSRWRGEEKELLWNSSMPHDSSEEREVSFRMYGLDVSDSGQYHERCWNQGNVTHERNSTLLICDHQKLKEQTVLAVVGQTVELTCDNAGPNQSVHWVFEFENPETKNWELAVIDDATPSVQKLERVKNESSLLVTAERPSDYIVYYCVERDHQRCDLLNCHFVDVIADIVFRSVGDSLELNCSDVGGKTPHVWMLVNSVMHGELVSHNHTLRLPSLTLNHTGKYICELSDEHYFLLVCPKSDPPAVVVFTGGENVTVQCDDRKPLGETFWLMKSNRTAGRVSFVDNYDQIFFSDTILVIANVSVDDSGEFWCVIMKDKRCVFAAQSLVILGGPEVDHHLVRSVLLTFLITVFFVSIVMTVCWSRAKRPLPVLELRMSDLSPSHEF